ncbi:MAG: FIG00922043: hypothetical protein [uncultured Thiotrichaceae bacterium]|uniref:DUF11 domain-containing protein n=1 Tax=uncultured Thiotrichaceae bacterium TaxID=298394 RepID=A0A6S6U5V2_9GAMM|nr:MAG: FIG00922043: hypothetical protein [uncultured Thiotrichaceae bacterium]
MLMSIVVIKLLINKKNNKVVNNMPRSAPNWLIGFLVLSMVTLLMLSIPLKAAMVPAGQEISNRAEISWFDTADGRTKTMFSNESLIIVAELFALELNRDNIIHATAGQQVSLPHRLTNTGNIKSEYQLEVKQDASDDADLQNLTLYADKNGNGIADAGEPVISPIACTGTATIGSTCYLLPEVLPGRLFGFVIVGQTQPTQQAGELHHVDITVEPLGHPEMIVKNTDVVDIVIGANLTIYNSVLPACGSAVRALETLDYGIRFTNTGSQRPIARAYEIDGTAIAGAVLENVIPPNTTLRNTTEIVFAPSQAIPLVQLKSDEDTNRWSRFSNWDGVNLISKVGLYIPVEQLDSNQSGKLEFSVVVDSNPTTSIILNEAYFEFNDDTQKDFTSNEVCTTVVADKVTSGTGETSGSGDDAEILFLTPSLSNKRDGEAPDFASTTDLEDATYYALDNGIRPYDPTMDGVYIEMHSSAYNTDIDTVDSYSVEVISKTGDTLIVKMLETGPNTGVFRNLSPIRLSASDQGAGRTCPFAASTPDYTSSDNNCVIQGSPDGGLEVRTIGAEPGTGTVLTDAALIDPLGVVFDSVFNTPVEGATVIVRNADGTVALDPITNLPYEVQTTADDGRYQFPFLYAGDYYIDVTSPAGYSVPSTIPPEAFIDRVVNQYSYGQEGYEGTPANTGIFTLSAGDPPLVVDVPADPALLFNPGLGDTLILTKSAEDSEVGVGEFLTYSVKIENKTPQRLYAVSLKDTLPYGFRYVNDTTFLDGKLVGDPVGAPGPNLHFVNLPFLEGEADGVLDREPHVLTYKVRVSAGAIDGDGTNSVVATGASLTSALITSNTSRATVSIAQDGVLANNGIVFGKVFVDTDCDDKQSEGEWPIGGVKLYMENGTWVITDGNGQYSLYGIEPGNHVIKVDPITLPDGLSLKPTDNRHMADPGSRLVDMVKGEFHRADFVASCPKEDVQYVYDQIKARNMGRTDWMLENAEKYDPNRSYVVDDLRRKTGADGDLSNGTVGFNAEGQNGGSSQQNHIKNKAMIARGYALQLEKFLTKSAAEFTLNQLPEGLRNEAYIYPLGDFHTVRLGFSLRKKGLDALQTRLKANNITTTRESTVYERLPMAVIDRLEAPIGSIPMPRAQEVVKTVTRKEAKAGKWLWPTGDTSLDGRFMAVVRGGLTPTLVVNGRSVSNQQIGERIANKREKAQVVAWYGVELQPGENIVEIAAKDPFGNMRTLAKHTFKRPDRPESISFELEKDQLAADGGRSYLPVKIKIRDKNDYPARGVQFVTLEATDGSFVERDIQDKTPGKQVRITNGERIVHLRSSEHTGDIKIRASMNGLKVTEDITFVAPLRPLVAAGIIDIRGNKNIGFDDRDNAPDSQRDRVKLHGRAAVFLKGKVKGDRHLTMSIDTDKDSDGERFRDINPNSFYPIYGDDSRRGYEAQSRSKVYAKLEKDKSSVMWGDYLTDSYQQTENVARVQRSLTGANAIIDDGKTRLQVFAAELEENHLTEEIRGQGTAFNYRIDRYPIVRNSEVVEIVTFSRDNPGVVMSVEPLTRFGDYILDDQTGDLSFTDSIPAQDENFNPVYIRVSYDVENNGNDYLMAGVRLNHQVTDELNVGVSHTQDENSVDGNTITGISGEYKSNNTRVTASVATMSHEDATKQDGEALRIGVDQKWSNSSTQFSYGRADVGFDNQSGGISEGREEVRMTHKEKINDKVSVELDAISSKAVDTKATEQSAGISANIKQGDWTLKAGTRHIRQKNTADSDSFTTFIVGVKRPIELLGRAGNISTEYEQDIGRSDRKRISLGGEMEVHEHIHVYGRAERINSLTGVGGLSITDERDTLSIGVKSDVFKSTELYSEYRLRGVTDGRDLETASGIRGTYELEKGLSVSPRVELVKNLEGDGNDSVAISMGLKDARDSNHRKLGRLEARKDDDRIYYGIEGSYVARINKDWSGLVRESLRIDDPETGETHTTSTFTVGLSHRPRTNNKHNMLFFYENKLERGNETEGDCTAHILSTHQNYEIKEDILISGRAGGKAETCEKGGVSATADALLFDGRVIWDVNKRWDVDIHGGVLGTDGLAEQQYSLGLGANYLVRENLRIGVGYNVIGFKEDDLDTQEYNKEGAYLGLQYKFDENSLEWLSEQE